MRTAQHRECFHHLFFNTSYFSSFLFTGQHHMLMKMLQHQSDQIIHLLEDSPHITNLVDIFVQTKLTEIHKFVVNEIRTDKLINPAVQN